MGESASADTRRRSCTKDAGRWPVPPAGGIRIPYIRRGDACQGMRHVSCSATVRGIDTKPT